MTRIASGSPCTDPARAASRLALRRHGAAQTEPLDGFMLRSLTQLRDAIPFEFGSIDLVGPKNEVTRRLCAIGIEQPAARRMLSGSQHRTVLDAALRTSGQALVKASRYGMASITIAAAGALHDFTWVARLLRSAGKRKFSDAERSVVETVFPHLACAQHSNARNALLRARVTRMSGPNAIVDQKGWLLERDDLFIAQLQAEWPKSDPLRLPAALVRRLASSRAAGAWTGRSRVFDWTSVGETRWLIGTRQQPAAGRLTPRERTIADLVIGGLTHQEAAHRLAVSINTVRSQLYSAHRKLGARNQANFAVRYLGLSGLEAHTEWAAPAAPDTSAARKDAR